jgi:hypothetical protein
VQTLDSTNTQASIFSIQSKKDIECTFFKQGGCTRVNCPYKHDISAQSAAPISLFAQSAGTNSIFGEGAAASFLGFKPTPQMFG